MSKVTYVQLPSGEIIEATPLTEADKYRLEKLPEIKESLMKINDNNNSELADFLINNETIISKLSATNTVNRVTKKEKEQLRSELELVISQVSVPFIKEHLDNICYVPPKTTRLSEEELREQLITAVLKIENDQALAEFVADNLAAIKQSYNIGKAQSGNADGLAFWLNMAPVVKAAWNLQKSDNEGWSEMTQEDKIKASEAFAEEVKSKVPEWETITSHTAIVNAYKAAE